ncbi:hypothetical protein [Jejuia spongiicola]|uniref:O-antigen ligase domain-containing protein n=1 Tax=Jejuia spongiicola TaxID=2942207 RepID=A0ABT0QCS8_9FLAO|nr:hypothetical protein [Jejuia spongiicola]MCL6294684.1 hypothetical protein [Jejuia spongiicola]
MNKTEYINKRSELLLKPFYIRLVLVLMICSYFYNLPVLKYSLKGDNEFRIYDILGFVILLFVFINRSFIIQYINLKSYLKYLNTFILWCGFTLIFTAIFSFVKGRPLWFIQTCLYYYHFLVFFYTAVLFSIYLRERGRYKLIATIILILTICESVLVFLQHYGQVPFLWNDIYRRAYGGFISGTLGPNKIVLGMFMFFSFVFSIGLFFQKQVKVNRLLVIFSIIASIATIGISGSRTTYLALIVFLCYLFISKTKKFFALSVLISIVVVVGFFFNLEVIDTIVETFENRVVNKVSDPTLLTGTNLDVGQLYEDLGAGRNRLSLIYLKYLFSNLYIVPIGIGLNNRLLVGYSAHNIYLSLINEVGVVGLFLYFKWLTSYIYLKFGKVSFLKLALNGLIMAMLVTLFFGEHLYIYRPLFAILGYFLLITILLIAPRYYFNK